MDKKMKQEHHLKFDTKEFDLPETVFSRDIENRVFQGIIVKALSEISGIALIEGNFLDTLMGRLDRVKGIYTEQDAKLHAIKVRIELNIRYGIIIPQKAEEVQAKVVEAITKLTGVRVSEIHIVFKELIAREDDPSHKSAIPLKPGIKSREDIDSAIRDDFEENEF